MPPFYNRGFNILCIEHRNHGRSGGNHTSYGYYEKYDLQAWIDWLFQRDGVSNVVGVHGESMGAAVAILSAAIDKRIAFIIADCPYARIADEFAYRLKVEYHLPRFPFIPLASLLCKLRAGFSFNDAAPLDVIPDINLPIFFIHGANDNYIPPWHSRVMFEEKADSKKLWLVPGAAHADSWSEQPNEYDKQVGEFLNTIGVIGYR
jgi:fermentation-respiration switch protein FrsA (DUF1100 family)